jgi:hypothetical protein
LNLLDKLLRFGAEALPVEKVDATTAAIRMAICRGCDKYDPERDKCGVCGCYMQVKTSAKTHLNPEQMRVEITHCPLGKWGDDKIAKHYQFIDKK